MSRREPLALVLSCEHAGNRVPPSLRAAFDDAAALLASHRGYDAGALAFARRLGAALQVPVIATTISRLVVDTNRHAGHPRVISERLAMLEPAARARLLARWHAPHRARVRDAVAAALRRASRVLHVAVHSFTPVLDGVVRQADVGLLYDPGRALERRLAGAWRDAVRRGWPTLRVRANYPYLGTSDGLTRWLRTCFADARYAGIELELNAGMLQQPAQWRAATTAMLRGLATVLSSSRPDTSSRRS